MTFADKRTSGNHCCLFGLPGNPVSAFVTFHLFVLPALRKYCGYSIDKLSMPIIEVEVKESLSNSLLQFNSPVTERFFISASK